MYVLRALSLFSPAVRAGPARVRAGPVCARPGPDNVTSPCTYTGRSCICARAGPLRLYRLVPYVHGLIPYVYGLVPYMCGLVYPFGEFQVYHRHCLGRDDPSENPSHCVFRASFGVCPTPCPLEVWIPAAGLRTSEIRRSAAAAVSSGVLHCTLRATHNAFADHSAAETCLLNSALFLAERSFGTVRKRRSKRMMEGSLRFISFCEIGTQNFLDWHCKAPFVRSGDSAPAGWQRSV